jgi:Ser/Thr protein kinase RdoA (MazF antagonist)
MIAGLQAPATRPPLPPRDSHVPLETVLSGDAMAEQLGGMVRERFELAQCRPSYIRYKPGQSCIVLYELALQDEDGGARIERLVHVRSYTEGRAARMWSRATTRELIARTPADRALDPALHLPELGSLALAFPLDLALPALLELGAAQPARYKPARKALVRLANTCFAKVYADERGARAFAALLELAAQDVPVVRPQEYDPRRRMLVQPASEGTPLSALRGSDAYRPAAALAGEALLRLHASSMRALPAHDRRTELAAASCAIGVVRPDLAREAGRLADRIDEAVAPRAPVAAHGDFYDDQVLARRGRVLLLDFDRVALADALLDVGTFIAHLTLAGRDGRDADAFLDGYGRHAFNERELLLAEAAGLLKLAIAPFRTLSPDWPVEVERRVRSVRQCVDEAVRGSRRRAAVGPLDRALPQLAELADSRRAARVLGEACREPIAVRSVQTVRHRQGRRCTLRYDISIGDPPAARCERVYAKTYASERAERVHRTLVALASNDLLRAKLAVPEPIGWSPRLRLVVQREVEGAPLTDRLLLGDETAAFRTAEAVRALHASGVILEREHRLRGELATLDARLQELPEPLASTARRVRNGAAGRARERRWRLRPIHRDLYHSQLLVGDGGRIGLLDFDDAAMSEPAVDVANFLAHLYQLALEKPRSADALDAVAAAFRSAYASLDRELDRELVRQLEALTLLRLAAIHLPRRDARFAEQLVDAAARIAEVGQ